MTTRKLHERHFAQSWSGKVSRDTLMEDTSLKNSSMYLSLSSLTGGGGVGDPVSISPPCDGLLGASKPFASEPHRCQRQYRSSASVKLTSTARISCYLLWLTNNSERNRGAAERSLPSLGPVNRSSLKLLSPPPLTIAS